MIYNRIAQGILKLEPLIIAVNLYAMWFPSPFRERTLYVLLLFIPVFAARYRLHGRILTRTPMDGLLLAYLVLAALSPYVAPYTRGLTLIARPLLGVLLYYSLVEAGRSASGMNRPLQWATVLALVVGVLAMGATHWNEKVRWQLPFIVNLLPTVRIFPGAEGGFNANEIAGAISFLVCLMAAAGVYHWRYRLPRAGITLAFVLLFVALMLGQSRMAIFGFIITQSFIIYLLIPRGKWQRIAWVALGLVVIFEIAIIANLFNPAYREQIRERDENSIETRLNMWRQGVNILRDYPLTGVGLNMFRDDRVKERYPIPRYEQRNPPHIHNEILQSGMDLGLPGIVIFVGFHAVTAWMLLRVWQRGDEYGRALAVGVGGGLLAHGIYGLADAVTLYDRFAFVFWFMLGVAGALYVRYLSPVEVRQHVAGDAL